MTEQKKYFLVNFITVFNFSSLLLSLPLPFSFLTENKFLVSTIFFGATTLFLTYKINYLNLLLQKKDADITSLFEQNSSLKLNYVEIFKDFDFSDLLEKKISFCTKFDTLYNNLFGIYNSSHFQNLTRSDFFFNLNNKPEFLKKCKEEFPFIEDALEDFQNRTFTRMLTQSGVELKPLIDFSKINAQNIKTLTELKQSLDLDSGLFFQNPDQIIAMVQTLVQ